MIGDGMSVGLFVVYLALGSIVFGFIGGFALAAITDLCRSTRRGRLHR